MLKLYVEGAAASIIDTDQGEAGRIVAVGQVVPAGDAGWIHSLGAGSSIETALKFEGKVI